MFSLIGVSNNPSADARPSFDNRNGTHFESSRGVTFGRTHAACMTTKDGADVLQKSATLRLRSTGEFLDSAFSSVSRSCHHKQPLPLFFQRPDSLILVSEDQKLQGSNQRFPWIQWWCKSWCLNYDIFNKENAHQ